MSKHMISDEDTINDVNPFVQRDFSLPGAVGKPHPFQEFKEEIHVDVHRVEEPHICQYGITSGDKTIDMCRPSDQTCPLSRPLYPGRNIDMGVDNTNKKSLRMMVSEMKTLDMLTIVLLVSIILTLSFVRR